MAPVACPQSNCQTWFSAFLLLCKLPGVCLTLSLSAQVTVPVSVAVSQSGLGTVVPWFWAWFNFLIFFLLLSFLKIYLFI